MNLQTVFHHRCIISSVLFWQDWWTCSCLPCWASNTNEMAWTRTQYTTHFQQDKLITSKCYKYVPFFSSYSNAFAKPFLSDQPTGVGCNLSNMWWYKYTNTIFRLEYWLKYCESFFLVLHFLHLLAMLLLLLLSFLLFFLFVSDTHWQYTTQNRLRSISGKASGR